MFDWVLNTALVSHWFYKFFLSAKSLSWFLCVSTKISLKGCLCALVASVRVYAYGVLSMRAYAMLLVYAYLSWYVVDFWWKDIHNVLLCIWLILLLRLLPPSIRKKKALSAVNYFCKKFHLRCLTRFWIHHWFLFLALKSSIIARQVL